MNKRNSKRRLTNWASAILMSSLFYWGCYPGENRSVDEYDTIGTYYNSQDIDYGSYTTFSILDSFLTPDDDDGWKNNNGQFDQQIINQVKAQMEARNYIYEPDPETNGTDLKMICKVAQSTTYVFYSYYPGYGGCYYCGGWYYPWYPISSVSSYSTGSLVIDMLDPNNVDQGTGAEAAVWTAGMNGLLSGSDSGIQQRVDEGIKQAFIQSPYLMRNP